jgi:cell division protein FtsW
MAVNLHLIPAKGMTLPFISYGGSSLISLAYGMGMLLALTRERPGTEMLASADAPLLTARPVS